MAKFKLLLVFVLLSASILGQNGEASFGWDLTYEAILRKNNVTGDELIWKWLKKSKSPAEGWLAELKAKPIASAILIEYAAFHAAERTTVLLFRTENEAFAWEYVEGGTHGRNEEPVKLEQFDGIYKQVSAWAQLPPKRADELPDQAIPGYMGFVSYYDAAGSRQLLLTTDDFFICVDKKNCGPGKLKIGRLMAALASIAISEEKKNYKHKAESEIAKMTVEQLIQEQISEHEHVPDARDDHHLLIRKYLLRDGATTFPHLIKLLDAYDPRRQRDSSSSIAAQVAVRFDEDIARLRSSDEGRKVIEAMKRYDARLRTEGGYSAGIDLDLRNINGTNFKDQAIADGLWITYGINMSEVELLDFVNYLIKVASDYPSWSGTEWKMNLKRNKRSAFSHTQGAVVKDPRRYYQSYLAFKRTKPEPKSSN